MSKKEPGKLRDYVHNIIRKWSCLHKWVEKSKHREPSMAEKYGKIPEMKGSAWSVRSMYEEWVFPTLTIVLACEKCGKLKVIKRRA